MSSRPTRPAAAASAATATKSATRTHAAAPAASAAKPHAAAAAHVSSTTAAAAAAAVAVDHRELPVSSAVARPSSTAGNGASSARRVVGYASSTASAILRGSESDEENDASGEGMGRRLNLKAVMLQAKAEAAAAAKEAAHDPANIAANEAAAAAAEAARQPTLAGAPDVQGPPQLPAQLDEDNDLFYCPRLTSSNLRRITGEEDLSRVTKLSLHLNTEEQELDLLNVLLPSLRDLHLIPPSFVSSFRDFGRSLVRIRSLSMPAAGLTDLDGIEFLTHLTELRAPGNSIADLSPLMFAPNLRVLDLAGNRIKERDMVEFIGVCTQLTELDLDGNPISMAVHYRNIVASRCTDIASFTLDGVPVVDAERTRLSEADESLVDRSKLRAWQDRADRGGTGTVGANQAALQRKVATADFNTLASGVRPERGLGGSGTSANASAAPSQTNSPSHRNTSATAANAIDHATDALVADPSELISSVSRARAGPALAASLGASGSASSSSALSSAERKREFQRYLESKESAMRDPAASAARRAQAKNSAVADIMRLEDELRGEQASEYAGRLASQQQAGTRRNDDAAALAVPRLQFDAAFSATSPLSSPVQHSPSASQFSSRGGAQPQFSLSTPRPSTGSGVRPGSSSGMRPGTSSGHGRDDDDSQVDSSSALTYGSDAIMAGNYAQAMRARKKQGSISISGVSESKASNDSGDSRSPSSSARPASRPSRSASPAPAVRISSTSAAAATPVIQQPTIVFKAKAASSGTPVLPSSGGSASVGLHPSRPLVVSSGGGGGSGSSMLQRHMAAGAGVPVGSPLAAARATATSSGSPAAARSAGKTYTLVRNPAAAATATNK